MYEMIIGITKVIDEMQKYHPDADYDKVNSAYAFAKEVHEGQTRKSGEPYIMHPLRVARSLASWGGNHELVCAALLHDAVEDCEDVSLDDIVKEYGENVGRLVDSLTSLDNELHNLSKEKVDRLSDVKFQKQISAETIYIKAADRLDNLNTIDCFPEHKKIKKAQHTREIIIPILKREGAFAIINELEDLCLKLEHPGSYHSIIKKCDEIRKEHDDEMKEFISLFTNLFNNREYCPDEQLKSQLKDVVSLESRPRSCVSIYRQIVSKFNKSQTELLKYVTRETMVLNEVIIVVKDNAGFQEKAFCNRLCEKVLSAYGISVVNYGETTYHHSQYFTLQDKFKNLYRLYIKTQTQYNQYMFGHLLDADLADREISFVDVDPIDPRNTYNKKIKVFTRDYDAKYMDEGATMLDLAYAVHSDFGYHFDFAIVDQSVTKRQAFERLNEGDQIFIQGNKDCYPKFKHLKYVRTSNAIEHITEYIEKSEKTARKLLEPLLTKENFSEEELKQVKAFFDIFRK